MEIKSVEDYLLDLINQRYAKRVLSRLATEHERLFSDLGKDPNYREYEWMKKRVLEIHNEMNKSEDPHAEKAED